MIIGRHWLEKFDALVDVTRRRLLFPASIPLPTPTSDEAEEDRRDCERRRDRRILDSLEDRILQLEEELKNPPLPIQEETPDQHPVYRPKELPQRVVRREIGNRLERLYHKMEKDLHRSEVLELNDITPGTHCRIAIG